MNKRTIFRRIWLGCAGTFLFLLLCTISPTTYAQGDPATELFNQVNNFRASQGLPPFQWNGILASAAQNQASWMAATGIFSHTQTNGSTPYTRAVAYGYPANGAAAETIVGGMNQSPRQGVLWWANSPVHYGLMTSSYYSEAGTAYAGSGDQNYYVMVLGKPPAPGEIAIINRPTQDNIQPLIITPVELAQPGEDGSIVHVIQTGQTLWTLAAYYDADLAYLRLINGLSEDPVLPIGKKVIIRLAEGQAPPPTPTPPLTHILKEGETLWYLTYLYKISMYDLLWFNGLTEDAVLQPGQELKVHLAAGEAPPPTPTPQMEHLVQSGDSAWTIAARYGLSLEQLYSFNGFSNDPVLRIGDLVRIRPPIEPTATPTYPATFTPIPTMTTTVVQLPAFTATSAPTPFPTATVALIPVVDQQPTLTSLLDVTWLAGIGLLVLAGITLLFARRT